MVPCTPSASEVTKKPPLTATSEFSRAATDEVVLRRVTSPSWVPSTVPLKRRGSITATWTFSRSAGCWTWYPVQATEVRNPAEVIAAAVDRASACAEHRSVPEVP